jgi:hypothetical protein
MSYPMGTLPLTALGKLNQVSPFIRHGIVSSVFPMPAALPHGFTTDIIQRDHHARAGGVPRRRWS